MMLEVLVNIQEIKETFKKAFEESKHNLYTQVTNPWLDPFYVGTMQSTKNESKNTMQSNVNSFTLADEVDPPKKQPSTYKVYGLTSEGYWKTMVSDLEEELVVNELFYLNKHKGYGFEKFVAQPQWVNPKIEDYYSIEVSNPKTAEVVSDDEATYQTSHQEQTQILSDLIAKTYKGVGEVDYEDIPPKSPLDLDKQIVSEKLSGNFKVESDLSPNAIETFALSPAGVQAYYPIPTVYDFSKVTIVEHLCIKELMNKYNLSPEDLHKVLKGFVETLDKAKIS